MKKILIMTLMIFLMVSLSGCFGYKSYEDLNLEYENFIANQQTSYEENIAFFNGIATETVQSIVLVKKQSASGTSSGSGVVFHAVANTYFVLTNNHVVYRTGIANYTISDYLGNDYSATYMFGDEDYDLAVLRITKKPDISLGVIPFGTENASIDNISAVLGYPNAQINAITLGKVYDYQIIDIDGTDPDIINVTFSVMMTTAPVKSGSSGSVVVNLNHELIGIVYAGNFTNSSDTSTMTFAIPVEKVLLFLDEQMFSWT